MSENLLYTLDMIVKKILNIPTVQRMAKHLFVITVIAWEASVPTASAGKIVTVDFNGKEITQERLSEGLKNGEAQYVKSCEKLAENFGRVVEDENLTVYEDADESLVRDYFPPFYQLIVGNVWDNTHADTYERDREIIIEKLKFLTALKLLNKRCNAHSTAGETEEAVRRAEKTLYGKARKFFKTKFPNSFRTFRQSEVFSEFGKMLETAADPLTTVIFLNGTVKTETSYRLFENFQKPFRLIFNNVKGTFLAGEQLRKSIVSLTFSKSDLKFAPRCFEGASLLEKLEVFEDNDKDETVFVFGERSFANCRKLQCPFNEDDGIILDANNPGNLVSAFEDCPHIDKKNIQKVALDFFSENVEEGIWKDMKQAKTYIENNQLDETYICVVFKVAKAKREAEERRVRLQEAYEALKKENKRQRKDAKSVLQKKQQFKQLLTETKANYLEVFENFLQVTNEYQRFKEQQTKIVEKLRKKLKILQSDNEVQKERIKVLEAFREERKDEIDTVATLEAERSKLEKRVVNATKDEDEAKRVSDAERKQNKKAVKGKNGNIADSKKSLKNLRSESTKTQMLSFKTQAAIKEPKISESFALKTMDVVREDEGKIKEVKNDDFRSGFQKTPSKKHKIQTRKNFIQGKNPKKSGSLRNLIIKGD